MSWIRNVIFGLRPSSAAPRLVAEALLLAAALATVTTSAAAADDLFDDLYGRGVHHYNSGRYLEAVNVLTQAIDAGSNDPRAYYYRGLAQLRQGFDGSAEDDFRMGGEIEAADVDGYYPVNRSLYRIQGGDRRRLEQFREEAKSAARLQRALLNRSRLRTSPRPEADVLREPVPTPKAESLGTPRSAPAQPPAASPPAARPLVQPKTEPIAPPDDQNPFADEPIDDALGDEPAMTDDLPDAGADDLDSGAALDEPDNSLDAVAGAKATAPVADRGGGRTTTGSRPLSKLGKALGETITEGFFGGAARMMERALPAGAPGRSPGRPLPPSGSFPGDPNAPDDLLPPDFDSTLDDGPPINE